MAAGGIANVRFLTTTALNESTECEECGDQYNVPTYSLRLRACDRPAAVDAELTGTAGKFGYTEDRWSHGILRLMTCDIY